MISSTMSLTLEVASSIRPMAAIASEATRPPASAWPAARWVVAARSSASSTVERTAFDRVCTVALICSRLAAWLSLRFDSSEDPAAI
jgi:hypothetical protein